MPSEEWPTPWGVRIRVRVRYRNRVGVGAGPNQRLNTRKRETHGLKAPHNRGNDALESKSILCVHDDNAVSFAPGVASQKRGPSVQEAGVPPAVLQHNKN